MSKPSSPASCSNSSTWRKKTKLLGIFQLKVTSHHAHWTSSIDGTHLETLVRFQVTQVLLQEQQVDAEVVVERLHHAQRAKARQHLVGTQEVGALARWSEGGVHHQRGEEHVHGQVDLAEQAKDAHRHQLALHRRRDRDVVLQQACAQLAGELVRGRGQADVVAEVDAGQNQGQEGQDSARQVLGHQAAGEALGLQILLHQRVFEASIGQL